MSVKGRNVSTLGGILSSSTSSAVTELVQGHRMRPSLLGCHSAGNPSVPSGNSLILVPNSSKSIFMGFRTPDECVGSLTCTSGGCVRLFNFASNTSDGM